MKESLISLKSEIEEKLDNVSGLTDLNDIRVSYLGKKGPFVEFGKKMGSLSIEEKKELGALLNELKTDLIAQIEEKRNEFELEELNKRLKKEKIDVTLPSTQIPIGGIHPINRVIDEIEELFISMGYDVVEGPEVELDLYNFEKLNIPKGHPARDMQDSFYIDAERLLRTQTSPVQARVMEANVDKGPIRIICPGKVYRRDSDDATHSHQFTQIEGLLVDKDISVAHLKGTLELVAKRLFGEDRVIRIRPSYFPFTEPSLEIDVSCFGCGGDGCSICKDTGWIEILGAGMVHPQVLKNCGYDPEVYSGFAFGMGPERIAMLKYGVEDIRDFYNNDLRFISNFNRVDGGDN